MLRKLALSLAVASALGTSQANALGLGEIKVNSALNEPLKAEIQLLETRDLSPLQIQPRMADLDQFSVAGITRPRFLSDVEFQVQLNPNGGGTIYLTSDEAVKEPFLSFLVELNWPNGRLVREYTLLLDPPVYDATPSRTQLTPAQAQTQPLAPVAPVSSKPRNDIRSRMDQQSQVYVDIRDVLWSLADRTRPEGVTVPQMMLALQRKNPHAFPTSNINHLKAGVVMDIPSRTEIESLSAAQARAEMARQTRVWRQRGASAPAPAKPAAQPIDASVKKSSAPAEAEDKPQSAPQGELKIVSPAVKAEPEPAEDKQQGAAEDTGSGKASDQAVAEGPNEREKELLAQNEALENRLAVTLETVDKIERDNAELNSKLDAIQEQMETLQRLLELKDQQMATLQNELSQSQEAARLAEQAANQGFVSKLMESVKQVPGYAYGAGGGLAALLLGLLLWRRRKNDDEDTGAEEKSGSDMIRMPDAALPLDEEPEEEVQAAEEPQGVAEAAPAAEAAQSSDDLDDIEDLSDLDLDMDLDLDESLEADDAADKAAAPADELDEAFDLGIDDLDDLQMSEQTEAAPAEDFDDALDDILGGDEPEDNGLETVAGLPQVDDEPEDTLESLGLGAGPEDQPQEERADDVEVSAVDDEIDDLEFNFDELAEPQAEEEGAVPEGEDDLDFALNEALSSGEQAAEEEVDDLDALLAADEQALDFNAESGAQVESADEELDDLDALLATEAKPSAEDDLEALMQQSGQSQAADSEDDMLDDLDALLSGNAPAAEESPVANEAVAESEEAAFDIDSLFEDAEETPAPAAGSEKSEVADDLEMHPDLEALLAGGATGAESADKSVEQELSDNIAHDLEMDLDSELDEMLSNTDDDIALEETSAEDDDLMGGLDLLEGADEVETKLDLARAYIDMDDKDGARDILNEIIAEGSDTQQAEAQKLLQSLS